MKEDLTETHDVVRGLDRVEYEQMFVNIAPLKENCGSFGESAKTLTRIVPGL